MIELVENLRAELKAQCEHCGTMSVYGKHVGAPLVSIETGEIVSKEQLQSALGNSEENLVIKDVVTGLLLPGVSTRMKTANGSSDTIPPKHAINPATGHVVPIEGNVCFDVVSRQLVFTCDSPNKSSVMSAVLHEFPMIPFIPYPLNAETGEPIETGFEASQKHVELKLGAPMVDPITGLIVPICAVTIHPRSHDLLPIGGCYTDPISGLPIPIELGSMLLDPVTNMPLPIISVTIDTTTGRVRPVGGTVAIKESGSSNSVQKTILLGERGTEPLSQLPVRVTSALLGIRDDYMAVEPAFGGYQTYIDSTELAQEGLLIKTIVYLQDLGYTANDNRSDIMLFSEELQKAHLSYKNVTHSRAINQARYLTNLHSLLVKKESCDKLASNGGSPGYMEFKATGQPLPLLLGHSIPDEIEGIKVPVLGYELHPVTGIAEPLAGTFESTNGNGRIPIMIGERTYDESTKELVAICGAKRNPETGVVVPAVQDPLYLLQAKKKEISKSLVRCNKSCHVDFVRQLHEYVCVDDDLRRRGVGKKKLLG